MNRLSNIWRLMLSPGKTWGLIFNSPTSSHTFETRLFYPLLALLAATSFFQLVYDPLLSLSAGMVIAVIKFVSYFIGFLISAFCLSMLLPSVQEQGMTVSDGRVRTFVAYNMSVIVIIDIVQNFLPAEFVLLDILPLYLLYVIAGSVKYFFVRKDKNLAFIIGAFCIIVFIPGILNLLLTKLMPQL